MKTEDEILIRILAATDAVWIPDRKPESFKRHTVLFERRRDFHKTGVLLSSLAGAGAGEAQRKAASRAVEELVEGGLVEVRKPKWARSTSFLMTDQGDTRARRLAGMPAYDHQVLADLHARQADPMCMDLMAMYYSRRGTEYAEAAIWHSELVLAGVTPPKDCILSDQARRLLVSLEERHLPLLVRGMMVSNFGYGVWYALTPPGIAAATGRPAKPPRGPRRDPEAQAMYYDSLRGELDRLATSPPRQPGELGELPLPHSPPECREGHGEAWDKFSGIEVEP